MIKIFASIFTLATISLSAHAQDSLKTNKQDLKEMKSIQKEGKQKHKEIIKDLNLSEAQKKELMANREESRIKTEAIKNDKKLTEAERNEKIADLHKEQKLKKEALLTPDQKNKLALAKQKHKEDEKEQANKRMADMKVKLSLSDEQVVKLKQLEKGNHAKMKAINEDPALDEAAKKTKMRELRNNADAQCKSILTADQLKKWEASKKDQHAKQAEKANK